MNRSPNLVRSKTPSHLFDRGLFYWSKYMAQEVPATGNKQERKLFTDLFHHYVMAKEDLDVRRPDWDKKDILFRSHIEKSKWPYRSLVFDPRIFTTIYEKTARLFANKPRGRMIPREGGDVVAAKINNELLSFQWDDNERVDGMPMLAKWAMMDLTARKYGASFALVKWHYERQVNPQGQKSEVWFDGPNFKPLNNRDVLHNPSYSSIKNWIQIRDYPTLQELMAVNDASRSKPIYKNLDVLRMQVKEKAKGGGDTRDSNYIIINKSIKGLQDFLGRDEVYKTVEVVTEYRNDRWVTFAPKHGVILRDVPNPYNHGQIPVVLLKYYPIDDDIYGLSEIEPVERIQKALNALLCQYLDAVNISTYPITKVRSTGGAVQMHTLQFKPGAKWLMQNPQEDVVSYIQQVAGVSEFPQTYKILLGSMQEALGDSSAATSNLVPGEANKTATEVKDTAVARTARDNFNQIFLSEAIKKQMMFWHKMNQQFLFSNKQDQLKVLKITGKDSIKYFQNMGLDGEGITDESIDMLSSPEAEGLNLNVKDFEQPLYPVQTPEGTLPKLTMEEDGQMGSLIVEPDDLSGTYDFIPDVESMRVPDQQQMIDISKQLIEVTSNPAIVQQLAQEGYTLKIKEILEDYFEELGRKDVDKYFDKLQPQQDPYAQQQPGVAAVGGGAGGVAPVPNGAANGQFGGVQPGVATPPNGVAQPIVS